MFLSRFSILRLSDHKLLTFCIVSLRDVLISSDVTRLICFPAEPVIVELVQLSDIYDGGRLLASYEVSASDFLYPYQYPSCAPVYGSSDRDVIMDRTVDFPVRTSCYQRLSHSVRRSL